MKKPEPIIIIDTREQRPFKFKTEKTMKMALQSGDYSVLGYETKAAIERKSLPDAYNSLGSDRARFERELARLSEYELAAVVVERDMETCLRQPPIYCGRFTAEKFFTAWIQCYIRYGVPFYFCKNRNYAKKLTKDILTAYWRNKVFYTGGNNDRRK